MKQQLQKQSNCRYYLHSNLLFKTHAQVGRAAPYVHMLSWSRPASTTGEREPHQGGRRYHVLQLAIAAAGDAVSISAHGSQGTVTSSRSSQTWSHSMRHCCNFQAATWRSVPSAVLQVPRQPTGTMPVKPFLDRSYHIQNIFMSAICCPKQFQRFRRKKHTTS